MSKYCRTSLCGRSIQSNILRDLGTEIRGGGGGGEETERYIYIVNPRIYFFIRSVIGSGVSFCYNVTLAGRGWVGGGRTKDSVHKRQPLNT